MNLTFTEGCDGYALNKASCGAVKHPCIDCEMGDWSEWGACSKTGNQMRRTRAIKRQRNQCGKSCTDTNTTETAACNSISHGGLYCKWGSWSQWASCPQGCGTTTTE